MPLPKISAILNNCSLHALTPELREEITKFASDDTYNNHHKAKELEIRRDAVKNKRSDKYIQLDKASTTTRNLHSALHAAGEEYLALSQKVV